MPLAIDELTLVALLGAFADGETVVRGAEELRVKESDRIAAVVEGLRGLGADIEETDDGFVVRGDGSPLRGGTIDSRGDHRLAMLGAVAGLASPEGVEVVGMEAAAVSYPGFDEDLGGAAATASLAAMVVAIDGPAGAGKSTVARAAADALGFTYLDSGAMYRAVGLLTLRHGGRRVRAGRAARDRARRPGDRRRRDVTEAIRTPEVTEAASRVATNPRVRAALVGKQRELLAHGDWVAEGRDIGTVVAPDAALKVFLTASPEERARRRAAELGADCETVLRDQALRDAQDASARALAAAAGAGRGRARHHRAVDGRGRRRSRAGRERWWARRSGPSPACARRSKVAVRRLPERRQVDARQPPDRHARGGRARAGRRHARPQGGRGRVERASASCWSTPAGWTWPASTSCPRRSGARRWRRSPTPSWPCSWSTRAPGCGPATPSWRASCAAARCR